MPTDPGLFEALYDSPILHPFVLWSAAFLALAYVASCHRLTPRLRSYLFALVALSCIDAWLTTRDIMFLGPLSPPWTSLVPLFFVLAGDFRYLLLVTSADATGDVAFRRQGIQTALGLTLIVPIFSQLVIWALPEHLSGARVLFLVYEVAFVVLTFALMRWHPTARNVPWIRSVSLFVVLYYGLWATADAVILSSGADWGFALRMLPNFLYYGGLIAVMGHFGDKVRREAAA